MKLGAAVFVCATLSVSASSNESPLFVARHFPYEPFGVYKGSLVRDNDDLKVVKVAKATDAGEAAGDQDAFHRAQHQIFHTVEVAEKMLLHAVEDEVDTLFHDLPKHEEEVADVLD